MKGEFADHYCACFLFYKTYTMWNWNIVTKIVWINNKLFSLLSCQTNYLSWPKTNALNCVITLLRTSFHPNRIMILVCWDVCTEPEGYQRHNLKPVHLSILASDMWYKVSGFISVDLKDISFLKLQNPQFITNIGNVYIFLFQTRQKCFWCVKWNILEREVIL